MEQKCDDITMFPHPISPIFPEAADLPISSLYKTKYPVPGWKNGWNGKYPWVSEHSGTWEACPPCSSRQ